MRVIGIDPGYDRLGVAILEKVAGKEQVIFSICIQSDRALPLPNRLFSVGHELNSVFTRFSPDTLAIETLFFNKNVKTALGVAQARGMVLYLAQFHNCSVHEYGPQEVKVAVTGYGKSDKQAVIAMVKRLATHVPEAAHDDEYDAIAVGLTCLAHIGSAR